jgi:hypothetical protein
MATNLTFLFRVYFVSGSRQVLIIVIIARLVNHNTIERIVLVVCNEVLRFSLHRSWQARLRLIRKGNNLFKLGVAQSSFFIRCDFAWKFGVGAGGRRPRYYLHVAGQLLVRFEWVADLRHSWRLLDAAWLELRWLSSLEIFGWLKSSDRRPRQPSSSLI